MDATSDPADDGDLGFSYRARKIGEVQMLHGGRLASSLRGADDGVFLAEAQACAFGESQQLMTRLTGNYKRGNERLAGQHVRNRK